MTFKPLFAAAALTFGLVTASHAQTTDFGQDWSDPINNTFFTDSTRGTLNSDADMLSRWKVLSKQEQEMVLSACSKHDAETSTTTTDSSGVATTTTTGTISDVNIKSICSYVSRL